MSKFVKLFEHGTQKTSVVTAEKLAEMKQAATFKRVYREEGEASEADIARYNQSQRFGQPLPKDVKPMPLSITPPTLEQWKPEEPAK